MRPMFFGFPEDENCYKLSDQYMFGPDILFALIVNHGQTERGVYLPDGRWVRTSDRSVRLGGQFVTEKAEVNEFIAFVRDGSETAEIF